MKRFWQTPYFVTCIIISIFTITENTNADADNQNFQDLVAGLTGIKVSGEWYLTFENGENNGTEFNEFAVQRGYINIHKTFNSYASARITPDISVDREGDGIGDLEMRLKYCYFKFRFNSFGFFTKPYFEFGLVHRPCLDFEQRINPYRIQGTMFLERNSVLNSGDYGLLFVSLLGGEINKKYKENVNKSFPGKYGSFAIGINNGGGYHSIEENENKTIEARFTLRPVPQYLPGLQFTYNSVVGKGNTILAPDWNLNSGFISYENSFLILTGTYFQGAGNYKGKAIDNRGRPLDQQGYSFFCDYTFPRDRVSLFARYDNFSYDLNVVSHNLERKIIGLSFHAFPGCKFLIDYDFAFFENPSLTQDSKIQTAIEVKF